MAQEKVKFYFTFFFAIRGSESKTFSTSNIYYTIQFSIELFCKYTIL